MALTPVIGGPGLYEKSSAAGSSLPDQTGNAGKFLTTDGTDPSWAALSGGGDVAASGTLTLDSIVLGAGGTSIKVTTTGTGVVTALGVNVGSAGAFVVNGGDLGTPSSGTATNLTGLPLTTGVTGTLPLGNGGTGQTTAANAIQAFLDAISTTQGTILYNNGTDWAALAPGTNGHYLQTQGAGADPQWAAVSGGTPAGNNTNIQYNNAGAFAGTDEFVFDSTTNTVSLGGATSGGKMRLKWDGVANEGLLYLENTSGGTSTLSGHIGSASNFTQTLPASTGTIVLRDDTATLTNKTINGSNNTISNIAIGSAVSGLGTGVATALAVNVGSAGALVQFNGSLGTPSGGSLANCTGLPISTGVSGLGSSIASMLSNNVGSTGAPVSFNGALGTPTSGSLTNCTGLPINTGLTISSQAQGDILYYNGSNWARLAAGTNGHYLQTQGAGANPQWAAASGGSGACVQRVAASTVTTGSTTSQIPYDGTIPQNTAGTEIFSQAFTPTSGSNVLEIEVVAMVGASGSTAVALALFVDSTADAIAATSWRATTSDDYTTMTLRYRVSASSTSARTYKLRYGPSSAVTAYLNRTDGQSGYLGGVINTSITITEYTP